jgi:diguanylate cyclase (GGDEF)-like protein
MPQWRASSRRDSGYHRGARGKKMRSGSRLVGWPALPACRALFRLGAFWVWALAVAAAQALAVRDLSMPEVLHFQDIGSTAIPRGVVASVAQDRQGLMWVGTGDGLMRFDGHRFRPMERDGAAPAQRSLGWVRALLPARDGRLWIGTESRGLALFDPLTGRLRDLSERSRDALAQPQILALAEDAQGTVWVGTLGGGLKRVDPATGRSEAFRHAVGVPGSLPDDRVLALHPASDGVLWLGTGSGLVRRTADGRFDRLGLESSAVTQLLSTADGTLWVGTWQGELWRLKGDGLRRVALPGAGRGAVQAMAEVRPGQLWVGRSDGIDLVDVTGEQLIRRVRHDPRTPGGLGGSEVTSLWLDREGWVWVGTLGGGLQRHDPRPPAMWVRGPDADPSSPLRRPNARSLLVDGLGRSWVGTHDDGIALLDGALQPLRRIRLEPGQAEQPRVQGMAQAADGSVWVVAMGLLLQFDPGAEAGSAPRLLRRIDEASRPVLRAVATDDGVLWLCSEDGLYRLRPGRTSLERIGLVGGQPLQTEVMTVTTGPDGAHWVGSTLGLFRLPPGADELQPVLAAPDAALAHPGVIGLLWDRDGTLWLDTAVAGLHRLVAWDGQQARFDRISERHGMLGRPFGVNLMADAQGRIWTHLHVYDPVEDRLDMLTAADGQHLGTGWFHSHAALPDGRLLFGGARGLLVVDPGLYVPVRDIPPPVLSELRLGDTVLRTAPEALVLPPGRPQFSVEITALEYREPARIRYAWRLLGAEADWNEGDADRRAATYTMLAPGRYTLQARTGTRAGAWSDEILTLPVEVLPFWWQRRTVQFAALALLILISVMLMQWRTAALRRREATLEALVRDRTRQLERDSAALREASLTDPLTGLRNRRFLLQHIEADLALALRQRQEQARRGAGAGPEADLLFFIIDLDHFKRINDRHGHAAGDAVLRQFSERLVGVFREADHLVRWGGEEFLAVARSADRERAAALAERLRHVVGGTPFMLDSGQPIFCTCSVGFAAWPLLPEHPQALDWEDTVSLADAALYWVKGRRRDGWAGVVAAPGMDPASLAGIRQAGWPLALSRGVLKLQTAWTAREGPGQ